MAEAEALLAPQKQKKTQSVRYYFKNSITGRRTTHSKYRPRSRLKDESGECVLVKACKTIDFFQAFVDFQLR